MKKAIFNWSGGKDSSIALHKTLNEKEYDISTLLTSVNKELGRVSMHGVRTSLLEEQAKQIGLPLSKLELPTELNMDEYNKHLNAQMEKFHQDGVTHSIFGDIFLEDLKAYRVKNLAKAKIEGVFPIWKIPTHRLMDEFLDLGFKAVVVCVNGDKLDQSFAGRIIDKDFVKDLPADVDVCGEYGEFHSFVFDGPIFKKPINFSVGETVLKTYPKPEKDDGIHDNWDTKFYYTDIIPK